MESKGSTCPLDSQYFGIISETDHRNGLCLCPLCTCKKHICPSALSKEPYPKSMYTSQYNKNFDSHKFSKPLVYVTQSKSKSSHPVNYQTTSEEFFKPVFSPASMVMPAYSKSPVPDTKFLGRSSYMSNYTDWGTGGVYYVTQQHLKHTSNELHLNAKSSYKDNFVEIEKDELLKPRKLGIEVSNAQKNLGLKIVKAPCVAESLTHRDFPDFSKKSLTSRETNRNEPIQKMKIAENHYKTVNQNEYGVIPPQIDHRKLRKQYEVDKKNLII